ncbi:Minor histocompatibility antigen H13 [Lachnellula suecica]|uniref:Minor histocompatibility antigen H13 n=1 Tax=Lachnellula suecica TaxID=602035 RepID=A0A8T9CAL3_9HELO|nr:Minor histocompatibility antigen H13 [Lachnellula suecica]
MDTSFSFTASDSPVLQAIGKWAAVLWAGREMYQMQIHLLLAAIFPIYIGSHAALRRPPSAKAPKKEKSQDGEDDEIEVDPIIEGLQPSDAILFPVLAGITLGGLYFLIKWLDDPKLLNKVLTWYFSALGIFGVGKLVGDSLHVFSSFVFPSFWSDGKQIYRVEQDLQIQVVGEATRAQPYRAITNKKNPLAGPLSNAPFGQKMNQWLWGTRAFVKNHWVSRGYVHGILNYKTKVTIHDVVGLLIGVAAIIAWNTNGKAWWLTNLMGFGFCYGTFQLMSPTTFWTGSMVLMGLFVYDIVMVFYTPMMVTVATTLDVPIKLVFPGPKRGGMLGLGDVVLPGIMMALALRFDLYLHYLRKQIPANSSTSFGTPKPTKTTYDDATGLWGERFWTSSSKEANTADPARFAKTYFNASIVGYIAGMLTTLVVLNIFNHAQPALLYLVPGVLISLWGTAWVRGEVPLMWGYTEDGSLDVSEEGEEKKPTKEEVVKKSEERENKLNKEHAHHVLVFFVGSQAWIA